MFTLSKCEIKWYNGLIEILVCTSLIFTPSPLEEYRILYITSSFKCFETFVRHETCSCPAWPFWCKDTLKGGSRRTRGKKVMGKKEINKIQNSVKTLHLYLSNRWRLGLLSLFLTYWQEVSAKTKVSLKKLRIPMISWLIGCFQLGLPNKPSHLFSLPLRRIVLQKETSYSGLPRRQFFCRAWCWCRAPPLQGVFPQMTTHPIEEMSRCAGKLPLLFFGQTFHTFSL